MFTAVAAVGLLASTLMLVGAALAGPEQETAGLLAVGYIGLVISLGDADAGGGADTAAGG